jgi:hypothetical protein
MRFKEKRRGNLYFNWYEAMVDSTEFRASSIIESRIIK